ncbi:hypothetical protein DL766_009441 [Monosporascus sp. MC13-8B]|uniref:NB-ARC domain-containing protein n=1 Tax=Monosporascus cannonballus TaxID=155416 RepID=A0ABY0H619_9PEZI|nr:hypothetical protein DL763_011310 [Monosporascus cannonballus]RYO85861.1 hypothetical protein DL762_005008 [Monosporascus cannonballus]RYP15299.1 hypothetical protein DL766_009441 [Monosporascus sp. MC13-8B]
MVPFGRNEDFIGRESILQELLERVPPSTKRDNCQRTAVEGLGGVGKTKVALEAAYRIRDQHPACSVFWVPAIDSISFEKAYREIGEALGVQGLDNDKADIKSLVKAALNRKNYEKAEEIHRQTLKLNEEVLGRKHPGTLSSINNLALILKDQGKYEEAEQIYREILELIEAALGKKHPDTLTNMNNLAEVLRNQGKYAEAEQIHRQALKLNKAVLGKKHPHTFASMNNIAGVLRRQGKYEEAE